MGQTERDAIVRTVIRKLSDNAVKTKHCEDQHMNLVDWDVIIREYRNTLDKPENIAE